LPLIGNHSFPLVLPLASLAMQFAFGAMLFSFHPMPIPFCAETFIAQRLFDEDGAIAVFHPYLPAGR
jgi:hypothetical protein